ncbi:MAG: NAD-dependent epimerase/dehydratase family protein [Acidimicrobiia bacterium]
MDVLVTGGAGFVGSHVVDALVDLGMSVRVVDFLHPYAHGDRPSYLNEGAEYLWGDLRDPAIARRAADGVGAVSHQAAMVGLGTDFGDAPEYVAHNAVGTAELLAALHRSGFRGPLVLAGSMVVYGEGRYTCSAHGTVRPMPRKAADLQVGRFEPACPVCRRPLSPEPVPEETPPDPRNVYGATKLHQEHLCSAFGRASGSPVTSLRYHNVYGPRMPRDTPYAGVASIFRSALESGRPPLVFEDGQQRRDFVHVADVAGANVAALTADRAVEGVFNVASGDPHTVLEMAEAISASFGGAPSPVVTGQYRAGDVRHVFACTRRSGSVLGFSAKVAFAEGMAEFARAVLREPASGATSPRSCPPAD